MHVHVRGQGSEAKFCLSPLVQIAQSDGIDARTLRELVSRHRNIDLIESVPAQPGTRELQIVIAMPYWGRGFGRKVAVALIQYAFSDKRVIAVVAAAHPENQASLALLEAFNLSARG